MRLLRLIRLIRRIKACDSLYLMTTAIRNSIWVLVWSFAVLLGTQILAALFLTDILHDFYLTKDTIPEDNRVKVYEYFGTFTRSMLSLFELTLANWPPVCRLLVENVSEWFSVLGVLHKLTVGFAVVGVINAVFIQETFKVAAADDYIMVRNKQKASDLHVQQMHKLFEHASKDNAAGEISFQEFQEAMRDETFRTWLAALDIDIQDAERLWKLLEPCGDLRNKITEQDLIKGMSSIRGPARNMDIKSLLTLFLGAGTCDSGIQGPHCDSGAIPQSIYTPMPTQ